MTTKQINDTLLQIANYEGQINVHNEHTERITADIEAIMLYDISKDKLDMSDLEELNLLRSEYHLESYYAWQCRQRIISLKKAAGIDLTDEEQDIYAE